MAGTAFYFLTAINIILMIVAQGIAQTDDADKLTNFFSKRCNQNSPNAAAWDKINDRLYNLKAYGRTSVSNLPDNKGRFCKKEVEFLIKGMEDLTQEMIPCLPQQEKYLPQFLVSIFREFLAFACANDGANIEGFLSSQGNTCRMAFKDDGCLNNIFTPIHNYIEKKEVCENIATAQRCFSRGLEQYCPDFKGFQTINEQLFQHLNKPCSGCSTMFSQLLLVITCLVVKVFM